MAANEPLYSLVPWGFLLWGVDIFLLPQVPFLSWILNPLLLFLIFLGFRLRLSSVRFLWLIGLGLGFLRDLGTGALWGGYACAYGLVGWILGSTRHLVELEDPIIQGIWAGILSGIGCLGYGVLLTAADPALSWNRWAGWTLPLSMAVNGISAAWSFPRLQRILR